MLSLGSTNPYKSLQKRSIQSASTETGVFNEIGKGFGAGLDQLEALGIGGTKALFGQLIGNEEMFQSGIEYYQEQMSEASAAEVERIEDIDGFYDGVLWASYLVGNVVPTLVGGIASGGVGGFAANLAVKKKVKDEVSKIARKQTEKVVKEKAKKASFKKSLANQFKKIKGDPVRLGQGIGAFTYSAALGASESTANLYEEADERNSALALSVGIASGALDSLVPMRALKKLLPTNKFKEAQDQISDQVMSNQNPIKRTLIEMAKLGGSEGVTEALQEIVQQSAVEYVKGQNDSSLEKNFLQRLFDEENRSVYLNAAFAGAIGGGIVGIPTGIVGDPTPTRTLDEATRAEQESQAPQETPPDPNNPRNITPENLRENLEMIRLLEEEGLEVAVQDTSTDQSATEVQLKARQNARDLLNRTAEYRALAQNIIEDQFALHIAELERKRGGVRDLVVAEQTPQNVSETVRITRQQQESLQQDLNKVIEQAREAGLNVDMLSDANFALQDQLATRVAELERSGGEVAVATQAVEQDIDRRQTEIDREIQERRITRDASALTGETIEAVNISERSLLSLPLEMQQLLVQSAIDRGVEVPVFVSESDIENAAILLPPPSRDEIVNEVRKSLILQNDKRTDLANIEKFFNREVTKTPTAEDTIFLDEAINKIITQDGADYNDAVTRAMLDLNKAGVENVLDPARISVPSIQRMMRSGERGYTKADGSYDPETDVVRISPELIEESLRNPKAEKYLRFVLAHELGHQFDIKNNISINTPEFVVSAVEADNGQLILDSGAAIEEILGEYQSGSEFGQLFVHPMRQMYNVFKKASADGNLDSVMQLYRKEIFAQAYAIYYSDKEAFKANLPITYEALTREFRNNGNGNQTTDRLEERNGILRPIRTSSRNGGVEVDDTTATGENRGRGVEGEQTDQGVGREGEQEDGFGTGRGVLDDDDVFDLPTRSAQEIERDDELIDSVRETTTRLEATKSKARTTFQKYLAPKGLLPETAFDSMIERDGLIGAAEIEVRQLLGNYRNAVREKLGRDPSQEDKKTLNDLLSGSLSDVENAVIPESIKEPLRAMRVYLDNYSDQYAKAIFKDIEKLVAQGKEGQAAAKIDLLNTIIERKGTYVTRSYRAFDDKNWFKKVPEEVIVAARDFLVEQGSTNPIQVINTILKEGTAYQDLPTLIRETKLGAKDLSNLMKRKNIAPEIRALLGEYTDPEVNFARSATKMSRYIFNTYFLERVLELGEGVFLFKPENAPPDHFVKIAADNSSVLAPLNGYVTTPEINQAFIDAIDPSSPTGLYGSIIRANAFVKFGKTVIAPTTMARNFLSAALFTVANGHFNWSKTSKALQARKAYFNNLSDQEMVDYLKEIKKLGVNYDSAIAGELIDTLKDTQFGADIVFDEEGATISTKAKRKLSKTAEFFTKAYQFGDDFWKIVGFENEVDILMNAKGITREEAMPEAAKRIRDTYPTYSLVGAGVKWLRRFPLIGTFVSFPYEIIRNKMNMLKYLARDMKDPDLKKTVPRRLLGLALANAGAYGLVYAFKGMLDVSDDEEEAIRLMAPPWSRNSNLLVTSREPDGKINYLDLSHMDPYAQFKRPVNALFRDGDIEDKIYDATWEFFKPFLGWDISTKTILELIGNKKESGAQIYNESDTLLNRSKDIYMHIERGVAPAVLQNLRRTTSALNGEISKSGRKFSIEDEAMAIVGFRTTLFDPKTALYFKAYEFNEMKRESVSLLTNVLRDPNDVSEGDIRTAFKNSSRARKEAFERMSKLVQAALKAGLTKTQAMMILRANNVTKADAKALVEGGMTAWEMSDSSIKNTVKKSDVLFGDKKTKQFKERFKLVNELLEQEI